MKRKKIKSLRVCNVRSLREIKNVQILNIGYLYFYRIENNNSITLNKKYYIYKYKFY